VELLQAIFSNNKLVVDAVEQAAPVLQRLSGKIAERLRAGGRIFCLGGDSPVPAECHKSDSFVPVIPVPEDESAMPATPSVKDIVIAMEESAAAVTLLRAYRRRGMLTACITCETASSAASAAETAIRMTVDPVVESRSLKVQMAGQMALDALLTLALAGIGVGSQAEGASAKADSALEKAAEALIKECPSLDRESAEELIQRHGSVKKAAKAYKENVQAKL
jgi:N-acetylmuramic acid 6-phosphate etherase